MKESDAERLVDWGATGHLNDEERAFDVLESAWADFLHGARTGMRFRRAWAGVESVRGLDHTELKLRFDAYRKRFENGESVALLHALVTALEEVVPAPYWVALAVQERVCRVTSMVNESPVSLHEAFGLLDEIPIAPKRWAAKRKDLWQGEALWRAVSQLRARTGLAIDPALRRVLASRKHPMALTKARRLYLAREELRQLMAGKRVKRRATKP